MRVHRSPAGQAVVKVGSQQQGDRLCDQAQQQRPSVLDGYDQVTFDVPGTGADVTCVLPAG